MFYGINTHGQAFLDPIFLLSQSYRQRNAMCWHIGNILYIEYIFYIHILHSEYILFLNVKHYYLIMHYFYDSFTVGIANLNICRECSLGQCVNLLFSSFLEA